MNESQNCRNAKLEFETVSDIGNDERPGNDECKDGIRDKVAADCRPDFFLAKDVIIANVLPP